MSLFLRGFVAVVALLVSFLPRPLAGQRTSGRVLASVPVGARLADLELPVWAHLRGADGSERALTFASEGKVPVVRGARSLARATDPRDFVVGLERRAGGRERARLIVDVLLDDGRHVVARATAEQAEALGRAGLDVERLREEPMSLAAAPPREPAPTLAWDPGVAAMVAEVTTADLTDGTSQLTGVLPATVEGAPYVFETRHTRSGEPIRKATQYAFERLSALGLSTTFHDWTNTGGGTTTTGRNVVGELAGGASPTEIVIVCGHVDDIPSSGAAPGADDNASGSVATLAAARILSSRRFERTIRFVLFTGEEQGLLGSDKYTEMLAGQGANVVAVLNLDMMSWSSKGSPLARLHTRTSSSPGFARDQVIAATFQTAVADYLPGALSVAITPDGETASDHSTFWSRGWPAILAIEDDYNDFTPNYHTSSDTLGTLNFTYFTSYAKAVVATAALLARPATATPTAFYTVAPCRLIDTRNVSSPPLEPVQRRSFPAAGACGVSSTARSVALNVTVFEPAAPGYLTLFPGDALVPPVTSTINFRPGQVRANNGVVRLGADGKLGILNGSVGSTNVIVDVVGYFE